ncbi:hypothetical protein K490DRAFT_47988 [Saccharata proteae CBS 121410]|uniref:Mitochondrial distribution and morphology protein 34 n=1 Tax=Saccharata proteae CBS 121410 TaxID=1314787 RepID=A0A9P4HQM2_9PEZI|nr:hypothetical protein K490DRAFT_47988 [Saccharata proteae CBS 121410]
MAFNFNWSPLIADTSRAREMLTTALNKSPKPPIIVDDIIVTELNLGGVPPELEILEIGDLAEDRFRGIFKMQYSGDAFLTLKTRVQANPLNTYLSTKSSFASPQPLAAAAGLTIPLEITLSDIRLSGFVILVFSRQKGLTLVFRNDPLESLKVSSTFDSIPFVRDYLQKEIEGQLRVLFMEDLPAILHRLSLRLWSPEYRELDESKVVNSNTTKGSSGAVDPLSSPPQDAVDAFGNPLDDGQINSFSLDQSSEIHASFSQKNLLRLAALTDSHRTLSLFTPSLRDTVFRAWAGAADRLEHPSALRHPLTLSTLSRVQSSAGNTTPSTYSISDGTDNGSILSRPTLSSANSAINSIGLGAGRSRTGAPRKRKRRIVNLRKNKETEDSASVHTETETPEPSVAMSERSSVAHEGPEGDVTTPPMSPTRSEVRGRQSSIQVEAATPKPVRQVRIRSSSPTPTPRQSEKTAIEEEPATQRPTMPHHAATSSIPLLRSYTKDSKMPFTSHKHTSSGRLPASPLPHTDSAASGGILEQAWMMKMATEIARKVRDEKERESRRGSTQGSSAGSFWDRSVEEGEADAPPAYAA